MLLMQFNCFFKSILRVLVAKTYSHWEAADFSLAPVINANTKQSNHSDSLFHV